MSLQSDLKDHVDRVFGTSWDVRDGRKVPDTDDIKLGNDAVRLDAVVLYADMNESTGLVDGYKAWFAAAVYKVFLYSAARVIRRYSGVITSFDGDRIMAVFIGDSKNSNAAKAALGINWARLKVINPAIESAYPNVKYRVSHVTGVDSSSLFVARTGIRGSNDLVWVGKAANHAAKLSGLSGAASIITSEVYGRLHKSAKYATDGSLMWNSAKWNGRTIHKSTWWKKP